MGCFLLKFAKILICTILMVAILSVPCFATNEGLYGHYISPGEYIFAEDISLSIDLTYFFDMISNDVSFGGFYIGRSETIDSYILYFQNYPGDPNGIVVYSEGDGWSSQSYRTFSVLDGFYISDPISYSFWITNIFMVGSKYDNNLLDGLLSVFVMVGQWITGAAEDLTAMFWADNSLTFVGVLAVASLAMAVSFLIIGLISRFLRFRG